MSSVSDVSTAQPRQRNNWWMVIAAGLSLVMVQLDALSVSVALPAIRNQLGTTPSIAQWVMLGFTLPAIALVFPAGRWLNQVGQRSALVLSIVGFALGGAVAGLADDIGWLIAARVLQGAFGAVLFVLMPMLVTAAVGPQVRGRAMGIVFTIGPLGGIAGPALAGFLVDNLGWASIFYVNLPIAVLVLAIGLVQLPRRQPLVRPGSDMLGEAALLSVATVSVMTALTLAAERGLAWLGLALIAVPALLVWRRLPSGRAVARILRGPSVTGSLVALWAQSSAQMALMFLIPFFLQQELHAPASVTGLIMVVLAVGMVATSPFAGWLSDKWSTRGTAALGMATGAVGMATLVFLSHDWSPWDLVWRLALVGIGVGLFAGANTALVMSASPSDQSGTASAAISLARQVGLGSAPALATILWGLSGYGLGGMRVAVGVSTALALVGFAALVRFRRTSVVKAA